MLPWGPALAAIIVLAFTDGKAGVKAWLGQIGRWRLFFLVIGEELGWRGYALPRLQARYGGLGASLILGILWAAWHLPNQFIPGLEFYGYGFATFALYVVAMTVLFTWLARETHGSVLLAWLFHGAINTLFFLNTSVNIVQRW
ncbi:MAG TPA: CPBP family intramembrane glutamic endopeptidase [Roseiflexaceae bacterium]|nr:CPBP family intramembrane glutamic endopeptidase [Roseiflexaceae bacterium]